MPCFFFDFIIRCRLSGEIMVEITDLEKQVLKAEYPQLSLSEDEDIERYFELRKTGRLNDALFIYNKRLKQKYPDEAVRITLMSSYRERSSRFRELLTGSLIRLAQNTIAQIKATIEVITKKTAHLNPNDVYGIIRQCEQIVAAVSNDKFAAVSFTQKYARYSSLLRFKEADMKKAAELIRLYVTDTLSSVTAYKHEQAAVLREEARLKNTYRPKPAFDFSKIVFTKAQAEAIIIPASIRTIEDQVIAYTVKYWALYSNTAFENAVLLYSRKYKTNHFNIFQAVKTGRMLGRKDEEILQAVLLNVVNGYYYSIAGDMYIQRQWVQAKASIEAKNKKQPAALPPPTEKKTKSGRPTQPAKAGIRASQAGKKTKEKTAPALTEKKAGTVKKAGKAPAVPKRQTAGAVINGKTVHKKTDKPQPAGLKPAALKPAKGTQVRQTVKSAAPSPGEKKRAVPEAKISASISEIIKRMSGARYKIYKGLFFENIRPSIRREIEAKAVQKVSTFGNEQNTAENLIYGFFEENYDNPYQNWQASEERKEILKLGFDVTALEPIIADWINKSKF